MPAALPRSSGLMEGAGPLLGWGGEGDVNLARRREKDGEGKRLGGLGVGVALLPVRELPQSDE